MSIIRRKSRLSTSRPIKTAAIVLVALCVFMILAKWTPVSNIVHSVQAQLYRASSSMNTFFIQRFSSSESLQSQLENCQTTSSGFLVKASYVNELEARVQELEQILGYTQTVEYETIAAKILSRSPSDTMTLLIDRGSSDGIKTGLAAVVGEGHLIGIVESVSEYTATVQLIEDEQTRIPVSILGESQTSGLLVGQGGFLLSMQYIPQNKELAVGDAVVTSELHERIPNNLVIGTIHEIIKEETSSFQEALIEPIYQSSSYSNLLIIDTTKVRIYEE